jgi:NADP-dependent 3-hydroxy acid dehydrogenase YdfG
MVAMADRLEGTAALVTGASSGIGEATALSLAALGADVAVVARRADRLDDLAGRIRESGRSCVVIPADVTDEAEASRAVHESLEALGRLDTVVNNAGLMLLGPVLESPTEDWRRMVDLNVLGLMYVARAALPHLLTAADSAPRRVADLVNVSSVAGRQVRVGSGIYNATKHAVGAFSEALRMEFTRRHVRVSLVEPGATATELAGHNRAEVLAGMERRFAGMERLQAQDIAETIGFMVTRPRHMAINEVLIRPTEQE